MVSNWWERYKKRVGGRAAEGEGFNNWQDRLFISFLVYCLPISLVAVIPGVYMSFATGYNTVGIADILGFLLLGYVTLNKKLPLAAGKLLVIGLFYAIAILLIATLGYIGPGVFYLFGLTILIALILPIRFAYRSVIANGVILAAFAVLIALRSFNSGVFAEYTVGQWLAFSANLIFFSLVLLVLLHRTFDSLQQSNAVKKTMQTNYQNIFEHSPSAMWLFDTQTLQFLDVNPAASQLYGYSRDEFLGMTIKDIRPDYLATEIEAIVDANRHNEKFSMPHVLHVKKNGEVVQARIESSLFDFNGRPAKLVLVNDITRQIEIEQEIERKNIRLRESEADLRAIFDSSIDGFVLLDAAGRIKAFNTRANEFITSDITKGEFKAGRNILNYVAEDRKAFFNQALRTALSGQVVEYDAEFGTEDDPVWIHYALTPVINGGEVTGLCVTGRNVTASKRYVQTIEQQNTALRDISWIQSHLVRAPLARVMSLTDLLANDRNECDKAEMLEYLKLSTIELDDIIRKITTSANDIDSPMPRSA